MCNSVVTRHRGVTYPTSAAIQIERYEVLSKGIDDRLSTTVLRVNQPVRRKIKGVIMHKYLAFSDEN